jgi:hypothetical protein
MEIETSNKNKVCERIQDSILNKGLLSDSFGNNSDIRYPKTGDIIKSSLEAQNLNKISRLTANATRLAELVEFIGEQPTDEVSNYCYGDIDVKEQALKTCPFTDKKYNWEMCRLDSNCDDKIVPTGFIDTSKITGAKTKEQAEACKEYNNIIDNCISMVRDLETIKVLKANIQDDQTYYLKFDQVKSLML